MKERRGGADGRKGLAEGGRICIHLSRITTQGGNSTWGDQKERVMRARVIRSVARVRGPKDMCSTSGLATVGSLHPGLGERRGSSWDLETGVEAAGAATHQTRTLGVESHHKVFS